MRSIISILLLISLNAVAQTKEFEGMISYQHSFTIKNSSIDKSDLVKYAGSSSQYYYKSGNYKWVFDGSDMEIEYYNASNGRSINRLRGKSTYTWSDKKESDTLIRYELFKNADTICGYVCDRLKVMIGSKSDPNYAIIRNISFNTQLVVDPENFKKSGVWCNYDVYSITRSIPLRIEVIASDWPFTLCYIAEKVDARALTDEEVLLPAKAKLVKQ
jgi:hypothetical protein